MTPTPILGTHTYLVDTYTYSQVETMLSAALRDITYADLPPISAARRAYNRVRASYDLAPIGSGTLTSAPDSVSKMAKGDGLPIISLALSPAKTSGLADLCAMAGLCADGSACVAHSGNGGYDHTRAVRAARTEFLLGAPIEFLAMIVHEFDRYHAALGSFAVRLNAYSDIRWERVLPAWYWERYSMVTFYDYTKHLYRTRPFESLPTNYTLTYSYSERTTARELAANIDARRNLAVVISTRGGKRNGAYRPIPDTVLGLPTVDGDAHDRRYSDPVGVAVVLRRKGALRADSPFVVNV